jgi:hypothetical protein
MRLRDGRAIYAFETEGPDGALVIKDGLAEVQGQPGSGAQAVGDQAQSDAVQMT